MKRTLVWMVFIVVLLAGCAVLEPEVSTPEAQPGVTDEVKAPEAVTAVPTEAVEEPTAEPTAAPTEPVLDESMQSSWLSYVDRPGNLYLLNPQTGETEQLTEDGTPQPFSTPGEPTIWYTNLNWSPDNRLLAYLREVGTPIESGFEMSWTLMVYDVEAGTAREVLTGMQLTGFDWRPGTHQIAYSVNIGMDYFLHESNREELAQGIYVIDVDSGTNSELVQPERGIPLIGPRWSPDGRYLAFDEVAYMEGRGTFAYYDFVENRYVSFDRSIGGYDWAQGSTRLVYDTLTYIPLVTERIFLADLQLQNEVMLSPDDENGYAFGPVVSPSGLQVAFWSDDADIEDMRYTLSVLSIENPGEQQTYGVFEQITGLDWTPDGQALVFVGGPMETRNIYMLDLASGETRVLAEGSVVAAGKGMP
jgi:Tol biopolymer transport system component